MKNQKGFTAFELIIVLALIAAIATSGGIIYVITHFISKFW